MAMLLAGFRVFEWVIDAIGGQYPLQVLKA
jgi:hypothetical protein